MFIPHCSLRFYLKTRWTTKSDQRTVFDSLQLYVCGLASPQCTEALVTLARTSRGIGGQSLVLKRQALVLQLLNKICHSSNLTGPKVEYKVKWILILVWSNFTESFVSHSFSTNSVFLHPRYWSFVTVFRKARTKNWLGRLWPQDISWSCATFGCYWMTLTLWLL